MKEKVIVKTYTSIGIFKSKPLEVDEAVKENLFNIKERRNELDSLSFLNEDDEVVSFGKHILSDSVIVIKKL